jgi:SAM-dependent methyltransferase
MIRFVRLLTIVSFSFLIAAPAAAQKFEPQVGQAGKDVIWVPTPDEVVDRMLTMAQVTPNDFVMDLGAGDGKIAIAAAKKFSARAVGIEYNPDMVKHANANAQAAGVAGNGAGKALIRHGDIFATDFSQATVITMYLLPSVNMLLRPVLLGLKPGTRIVSHDFDLGDWPPDRKTTVRKNTFLWIVPAQVAGRWRMKLPLPPIERLLDLELTQRHQEVSGRARLNGVPTQIWEFTLAGDRVSFVVVDATDRENEASLYFTGRVVGDVMEGELTRGVGATRSVMRWRAVKDGT